MDSQVIYFSRAGSTKKVADAIAAELEVTAETVKNATLRTDTFVFLGSGCYGGKPGRKMKKFIEKNNFINRTVALFGTSGGGEGQEVKSMEEMINQKDGIVKGKFFCKGKFWFGNKGKPSDKDLDEAKQFAKNMTTK